MNTKERPGPFDGYGAALPDEPLFVILGRDPNGPNLVTFWAEHRMANINLGSRPVEDIPQVTAAMQVAMAMRSWRAANDGAWRRPPFCRARPADVNLRPPVSDASEAALPLQLTRAEVAALLRFSEDEMTRPPEWRVLGERGIGELCAKLATALGE